MRNRVGCLAKNTEGAMSALEFGLRWLAWARGRDVTIAEIQARWDCHRATAYRYRAAWNAVRGKP